jgi:hypothetical protein
MKLYTSKIPVIAREIIQHLTETDQIEVNNREEAELDIESVLKEYLRRDREITERTKDIIEQRGLPYGHFAKTKRLLAEREGHSLGEDAVVWVCSQILETFMQSQFVEEVYATDFELRKEMTGIIRRHTAVDEELDAEVRQRIKNLEEGGAAWEVEYGKVMEQIKRKRGLNK